MNMTASDRPTIPPELLICAYLGQLVRDTARPGRATYLSYEEQAKRWGMNKPTLIKLSKGGTVDSGTLFHLASKLSGGSVDALERTAARWWHTLSAKEQETVSAWAATKDRRVREKEDALEPKLALAKQAASRAKMTRSAFVVEEQGGDDHRRRRGTGPGVRHTR